MTGQRIPIATHRFIMKLIILVSILTVCNLFAAAIAIEPDSEVLPEKLVWIGQELPGTFQTEGDWTWSSEVTKGGVKVHGEEIAKGLKAHLFRTDVHVKLNQDSKIIQYVNIDPKNMTLGIMLKLFLNPNKEISLYWEGEEEAFVELDEYIAAWYMGPTPEPGKWIGLEIDSRELDIKAEELVGMEFIVKNGRAWWGETVIINQGLRESLLDKKQH